MKYGTILVALMMTAGAAYAQKPVEQATVSTRYKQPPSTPAGLYAVSDTVLVVRVSRGRGLSSAMEQRRVLTEVTATIVDVVKLNPQVGPIGSTVTFLIVGGEIDRGDHIERHVSTTQPPLIPGHEYLVALNWSPNEGNFVPSFGPGSVFEVLGGVVKPQAPTALASKVTDLSLSNLIVEMKQTTR